MFDFLKKLIEIPSVATDQKNCERCLDVCLDLFKNLSVVVKKEVFDGVPSAFVSNTQDNDLDVMFLCHLDVVPAPDKLFHLRQEGDTLYGRGVYDMKGPAVAALWALKDYFKTPTSKKVGILLVCDEEMGGEHGTKIWAERLNPQVILEPDSGLMINQIIEQAKQPLFVQLTAVGKSAHGSRPWLGIDAIQELMTTICLIQEKGGFDYYREGGKMPDQEGWVNTLHVGQIQGGKAMNSVADEATAVLDFRLIDTMTVADVMHLIQKVASSCVRAEIISQGVLVKTSFSHPMAKRYQEIVESVIQEPLKHTKTFGASDGRYFAHKSVLLTHQANGCGSHGDTEQASADSLEKLCTIFKLFLESL